MLKHIFQLIWKKKQRNFLMMLEIFFAFLVLFAVSTLSVYNYQNYQKPSGIVIDDVWVAFMNYNTDTLPNLDVIQQRLKSYPEIASFSFTSGNVPFSFSTHSTSLSYNGAEIQTDGIAAGPSYPDVMGITLAEGRWFSWEDTIGKNDPIVITRKLKEALFGDENAVGKILSKKEVGMESSGERVVGVVENFKHKSDYQLEENSMFRAASPKWDKDHILIKLKSPQHADFEARLSKDLVSIGKDWSVEIQHLDAMKSTKNQTVWVPILILFIVCGFLVFNVALGLFGVLFQNISQRRGEIGVRRAMGATKKAIMQQIIGETAMIATFGLILGLFFAVQFPLLNLFDVSGGVYGLAMLLSVVAVYALVIGCSYFPSRQAAWIYPAEALRED